MQRLAGGTWSRQGSIASGPIAAVALGLASVAGATAVAWTLETWLGVGDASAVYLLAVVLVAGRFGTWPAVGVSIASFLVYDFLFTEPRFTFAVGVPQEWLSLLLFLVVAVVIGRLSALHAERAAQATLQAHEAHQMFAISRLLATTVDVRDAATGMAARLKDVTGMDRIWIGAAQSAAHERQLADTAAGEPRPDVAVPWLLHLPVDDHPAEWMRTHVGRSRAERRPGAGELQAFRVSIEVEGRAMGSLWAYRAGPGDRPDRAATRLLSLAADQIGMAMRREQLAAEAASAEVARESDALKSALLDSVSHDLRTPLATIRAMAGGLLDEDLPISVETARKAASGIDTQAARLSEVVTNLLDLSRLEGGAIRPELEAHEPADLVRSTLARHAAAFEDRAITMEVPDDLRPVLVDALFFDQALANILENAARYADPSAAIRVRAEAPSGQDDRLDLIVEDGGPGVDATELPRLFERFYRRSRAARTSPGVGIGLTVARGLIEAMDGTVDAEQSALGGLAIRLRLRLATAVPSPARRDGSALVR